MKKYTEEYRERLLNVTTCFNEAEEEDVVKVWRQEYGLDIKLFCVSSVNRRIDVEALELFGTKILKDSLLNSVNYYQLFIPSTTLINMWHAVAFMIDHKQKVMRYHDSRGVDMRPEMKDFLVKLFPGYEIMINYSKQQADVVSAQKGKNDNSCGLLALYNLRDMWFEQTGQPDKVCDFHSLDARQDVWNFLEPIVAEEESPKQIQKRPPQTQESFEYRLYNEPNYEELIDKTVQNVRTNFENYRGTIILSQGGNGRI